MPTGFSEQIGIEISVKGANEGAAGIDKLSASLENLNKVCSGMPKVSDKLKDLGSATKNLQGALKTGFAAAGLMKTAKLLAECIGKANDYLENLNLFNAIMGKYTDSAYEYGQAVSDAMGIDVSEWIRYEGTFMSLAKGFGVASDRAAVMSEQFTQLGYDIASFFNISNDQAMLKLEAALAGELEPIRRLGYDISKAKLEAVALELGITKAYSAMTQAEKAQLRYYAIMTQLPQVQGDFARTLDQPANMLRILKNELTQLARAIGNLFIPMVKATLPVLVAFVQLLEEAVTAIAKMLGIEIKLDIEYNDYDAISGINDNLEEAVGNAKKLKKQLAGFDEINNLTTPTSSGSASAGSGWLDFELPTYDFISDEMRERIDKIKESLSGLLAVIAGFGASKALPFIGELISKIAGVISGLSIAGWAGIIAAIAMALVGLYGTCEPFREWVDSVMPRAGQAIAGLIEYAKVLWLTITQAVSDIWGTSLKPFVSFLASTLLQVLSTVITFVGNLAKVITMVLIPTIKLLTPLLKGIITVVGNVVKLVVGYIGSFVNTAVELINGLIKLINKISISIPNWSIFGNAAGKKLGFNLQLLPRINIPMLAEGGIINSPTMAMVGEDGAEAVMPLENNTGWINALATKINNVGGNNTDSLLEELIDAVNGIELSPRISVKDIGEASISYINRQKRLMGGSVI